MMNSLLDDNKIIKMLLINFIGLVCLVQSYAYAAKENQSHGVAVTEIKTKKNQEIIILIHGLLRSSLSMWPLKMYLKRQGYQVHSYSYPSAKYTIKEHGAYLNQFIKKIYADNPGVKINFVTHSLGGIITREAVSQLPSEWLKNTGCLIMLAPPNQGSKLAKLSTTMFPLVTAPIRPLAELSSDKTAYVHQVPVPKIRIGIIAGRYDAKVPPEYARLQGYEFMVVNSNHTFIMNNAKAKQLIISFLKNGTFNKI